MTMHFEIDAAFINEQNLKLRDSLDADYEHLAEKLQRTNVNIEDLTAKAQTLEVAVPSWGVGTGGAPLARFSYPGDPRNVLEKLEACEMIFPLVRTTAAVSLHIPWDQAKEPVELRKFARERGLHFDAMNSNTFQDQSGQKLSYKFGSLTHPDPAVR